MTKPRIAAAGDWRDQVISGAVTACAAALAAAESDQRDRRARRRCWKTFATLTKRRLKRGVFRSVIELNQAIRDYLDAHNTDPKPFRWTAPADTIIAKHQRGKRPLQSLH